MKRGQRRIEEFFQPRLVFKPLEIPDWLHSEPLQELPDTWWEIKWDDLK